MRIVCDLQNEQFPISGTYPRGSALKSPFYCEETATEVMYLLQASVSRWPSQDFGPGRLFPVPEQEFAVLCTIRLVQK